MKASDPKPKTRNEFCNLCEFNHIDLRNGECFGTPERQKKCKYIKFYEDKKC